MLRCYKDLGFLLWSCLFSCAIIGILRYEKLHSRIVSFSKKRKSSQLLDNTQWACPTCYKSSLKRILGWYVIGMLYSKHCSVEIKKKMHSHSTACFQNSQVKKKVWALWCSNPVQCSIYPHKWSTQHARYQKKECWQNAHNSCCIDACGLVY